MALLQQLITVDTNHTAVQRLAGFSIHEDSSAAAEVKLRIGAVGGAIICHLALAADESASIVFPKAVFISAAGGTYVEEVAGSVEGMLFYPDT